MTPVPCYGRGVVPDQQAGGYAITSVDALERVDLGHSIWRPVRRPLELTGVAVNAYSANAAGDGVIEPHDDTSAGAGAHEELYSSSPAGGVQDRRRDRWTLRGHHDPGSMSASTARRRDRRSDHGAGRRRAARAPPCRPRRSSTGSRPSRHVTRRLRRGDPDRLRGPRHYPEHPTLRYQLACYEALAGPPTRRPRPLRDRGAGRTRMIEWAADDADLDSIREDPRFPSR